MIAYVLLNLLNEFRKRDKMWGLSSIVSFFRNKFNKFNNTGARMLDSIYHVTLKLIKNGILGLENVKLLSAFTQNYNGRHLLTLKNM